MSGNATYQELAVAARLHRRGRVAKPRKPGGERSAKRFAESEREEEEAHEANSHRDCSIIVPWEAEGLWVENADGAEGAGDTPLQSIGIDGGVQETVNTASVKGRNHKRAVAEGFASANNPIGVKIEFDTARKAHPHIADGLPGGGSKRNNISAMKTVVDFMGREFPHREKDRLDGRMAVLGGVNNNLQDRAGIGLRHLVGEVGFVDVPNMPIK
jgi:hypothetical protein